MNKEETTLEEARKEVLSSMTYQAGEDRETANRRIDLLIRKVRRQEWSRIAQEIADRLPELGRLRTSSQEDFHRNKDKIYSMIEEEGCECQSCGNSYKVDLNVSDELWEKITDKGERLLCGPCIIARIENLDNYNSYEVIKTP